MVVTNDFKRQIALAQSMKLEFLETITLVEEGKLKEFVKGLDGLWRYQGRVFMLARDDLWKKILEEAHRSNFTIHLGTSKMYQDLKRMFWWPSIKKDIAKMVSRCFVCQKVKIEHQKPLGMFQPLEIPEQKWEGILMHFVTGLLMTQARCAAIWEIMDRLKKLPTSCPLQQTIP